MAPLDQVATDRSRRTTVSTPPRGEPRHTSDYLNRFQQTGRGVRPREDRGRVSKTKPQLRSDLASQDRRGVIATNLFWLNLGTVLALFVSQGSLQTNGFGQLWTSVGRISGLIGTNLMLVQVMLIARTPFIEKAFGFDRVAKWHGTLGRLSFSLIVAHFAFIVAGKSALAETSLFTQAWTLALSSRDMLMAAVSFGLLLLIVGTSVKIARSKLRRETWMFIHLYSYAALAFAVPHMLTSGATFVGKPITQVYWAILYTLALSAVLFFRIGQPLYTHLCHGLRVVEVRREASDVVSITVQGKRLEDLTYESGQFFNWRFLTKQQWFQAHPYSVSAAHDGESLRLTVKALGDGSADVAAIKPGTKVLVEGPFGTFTADRRTKKRVLMIAGGVGITPLRAMLESMPAAPGDITFIYRVRDYRDAALLDEVLELSERRGVEFSVLSGSSSEFSADSAPFGPAHLSHVMPDIANSDVFVCGPKGLVKSVIESCKELEVPASQVHYELFEI